MNAQINVLAWPLSRLGEGIEALARQAGLKLAAVEIAPEAASAGEAGELGRWIEWASERLGLEAEPVETTVAEFEPLLRGVGPALFSYRKSEENHILLVLGSKAGVLHLIGPDLGIHRCPAERVRAAFCSGFEAPIANEIDQLIEMAGIPKDRRTTVRSAMLRERLGKQRLGGCWLLRLPPTTGFWQQLLYARLPRRVLLMLGVFVLVYGLEILGWGVIGQGALGGRLDAGWLTAWALLVLSLIPLQLLGHWLDSTFALDAGRILKQRLLAGALGMDLESVRHQGAGQLLGRVIESQALESLALNSSLTVLIACVELAFAAWILASGAGGRFHLLLLLGWVAITVGLSWRYFRRLRRCTLARLGMTHDLVERMVGHRTCLAQEPAPRRNEQEDHTMDGYLNLAQTMDEAMVPVVGAMARGWLLVGLIGLTPAFVSGNASQLELAIGLGGMLLASRALTGVSGGLAALARAGIAWTQVAPLFHAAKRKPTLTPFASSSQIAGSGAHEGSAVLLDASDLIFRYRPQGEAVLRGVNLTIQSGERVLLEGSSGGGKSTLAALLVGLRTPETGLLLLKGLDRHTLGEDWRRLATAAPQFHENHILTGTLAFNLLMGRRWPAMEEDLQVAEALCLDLGLGDLLERMPSGLMQMVGETGWQLSHGERSRVYLARALLQNAQLTVLDESFAALDPETLEKCLNCAVKRARTLLVIAHP